MASFKLSELIRYFFPERHSVTSYYLSVCCIVKDENRYLEEWINYHRRIGVEHFFIYDNESTVPVSETLKELNLLEYVTIRKIRGRSRQVKAYGDCIRRYGENNEWIAFIDVDEFLVPKQTNGDLPLFLKEYEGYGGLGVNWLIFGSGGHLKRTEESQLKRFIRRSAEDFFPNSHIKSIVQPKYVKSAFKSHCFRFKDGHYCVNENFVRIEDAFSEVSVQKIQLNHYYCRSYEEYQEKIRRGLGDSKKERKIDDFHYHDEASNLVEDQTILQYVK